MNRNDTDSIPSTPLVPAQPTRPAITQSILLTVKKMLGIDQDYHAFDTDLIVNINSVFLTLNQLAVGPEEPFRIENDAETWSDFLGDEESNLPGVQSYVYLRTRLLFDPPTNSFLVDAMQKQCDEFEWRLNLQAERGESVGTRSANVVDAKRENSLRAKIDAVPSRPTKFYHEPS